MVWRSGTLAAILLALLVLTGIAFASTRIQYKRLYLERTAANAQFRQQWEQLKAGDPHSAAHFGTWIFKPVTLLGSFDKGIDNVAGYTMRVEAHVQHNLATSPLRPADTYLRLGELTMANVLLLFFPLFILCYCFNSYTQEKASGTLQLLLLQGASRPAVLRSKAGLHLAVVNTMLLTMMLAFLPALLLGGGGPLNSGELLRILLLLACYACYCSIFVLLGVILSAIAGNARQALLIGCGIWLLWNVLLPRLSAAAGDVWHPLPSQHALEEKIEKAIKTGINGDDPREARLERLTRQVLKKYNVTDISSLPVNFDAIRLQSNEDYAQMVYGKYAAETDSTMRRQNNITRYAALADPFLAVRSISMALCGTDYDHHWHFDAAARSYRHTFIRRLNNQQAYGGGSSDQDFYRQMPRFHYEPPGLAAVLRSQLLPLLSLLLWLPGCLLLLNRIARHEPFV
ncbi:ABC-2 type transport system permease protein [Chitinophaga japonensis]|uniref:ABC-2 type transport system permease protein n=2 Tax=Chitinophaga japonensis TaxID=104662 RepID=A0A562SSV3_CHIJA|nr:ABC-2 type transport system permease protein [Chitinophaga japonensis]